MEQHWARLEGLLHTPITRLTNGTLLSWIDHFHALPNWRQRWCTRLLKIEPCLAYLKAAHPAILYVGLRADEPQREGIYSADFPCRFPLREWGWSLATVRSYLTDHAMTIPPRTDCAFCYGQRLTEWRTLWRDFPALYAQAEALETASGATFRSPGRDTWPASLTLLRADFARGRPVRGDTPGPRPCRACTL
jgi:hypothetical protein